jgi:hypothetical protein
MAGFAAGNPEENLRPESQIQFPAGAKDKCGVLLAKPFLKGNDIANISFGGCGFSQGHATVIPAIFDLKPENNRGDENFIKEIKEKLKRKNLMKNLIDLLEANHNLILTGAPGTGKTYLAKEIAKAMPADSVLVQFHPSYDYTDFVEGLRPISGSVAGAIGFERKDGVFKEFCKKALDALKKWQNNNGKKEGDYDAETCPKYVFIIDEINRGEISKIFGELFFSIDPGYRGMEGTVMTQYQNLIPDPDDPSKKDPFKDGFYVPKNVYIIGTMNDIDRSVESFDFAMRRRFVFKEITADNSAGNMGLLLATKDRMQRLNEAIEKIDGLNASYRIGGAYFRKVDSSGTVIEPDYLGLWKMRLEPLLKEYLRGMPDADGKLTELKAAYDGKKSGGSSAPGADGKEQAPST